MKKRILVVFGTRPEAIKMLPIYKELKMQKEFEVKLCITAQHRKLLDDVLELFCVKADFDLDIMSENQTLFDITVKAIDGLKDILYDFSPELVLVHGDTTTTFCATLASFYMRIKVAHVEAGLRTNNLSLPFPEEANRQMCDLLSDFYFAPTLNSKENLLKEGKKEENILVCGNSVIDALYWVLEKIKKNRELKERLQKSFKDILKERFVLVTLHRREIFGEGLESILEAIKYIVENSDLKVVFPMHPNPSVQKVVKKILKDVKGIFLSEPFRYEEFIYLMSKSYFIITDSGGIQEEAPSLKKPLLVVRDVTEREELLKTGCIELIGVCKDTLIKRSLKLLEDEMYYESLICKKNPYGDGKTSKKIVEFLKDKLEV